MPVPWVILNPYREEVCLINWSKPNADRDPSDIIHFNCLSNHNKRNKKKFKKHSQKCFLTLKLSSKHQIRGCGCLSICPVIWLIKPNHLGITCAFKSYHKYLHFHSGPVLIAYLRMHTEDFQLNSHSATPALFVSAETCDLYILSTDLTMEQATSSLGLHTQTQLTIIQTESSDSQAATRKKKEKKLLWDDNS